MLVDYILIIRRDVTFTANPNEVMDTKFVTKDELRSFLADADKNGIPVTPWFQLIVKNFLYKWWDNLDNLKDLQDTVVHRVE